jgi:hypothetical protein
MKMTEHNPSNKDALINAFSSGIDEEARAKLNNLNFTGGRLSGQPQNHCLNDLNFQARTDQRDSDLERAIFASLLDCKLTPSATQINHLLRT